jgi:hypothetical protein
MNPAIQESEAFPLVRARIRKLLMGSPAFRSLPKGERDELAHNMVRVASYIVSGEQGDSTPNVVGLASDAARTGALPGDAVALASDATSGADLPGGIPRPGGVAGADFQAAAAQQGGRAFTDLVREVNFPDFVAGLIDGVFNAIVNASIQQMEAYSELVKNVAKSVDQYMKDNVSEDQARDYLADRYPDFMEVDIAGDQPKAKPKRGYDEDNLPDFFRDLGLDAPVDSLNEDTVEEVLVPAARRRMAMDRQQLLATMVLMGINRIVVTTGNISASVLFRLDTTDVVERGFTQTAEQKGGKYEASNTRPGFWGWFRPSVTRSRESSWGNFKVSTTQEEDSEAKVTMKTELAGKVNINFRSETFPLERMTDILVINEIQQRAPNAAAARPVNTP